MKNLEQKNDLNEVLKCYGEKEYKMQEIAMISLMYSSGMGVKDICTLTYYDFLLSVAEYLYNTEICPFCFEDVYSHLRCRDDAVGRWELYNLKTDTPYVTFCTAETSHAILDWLYIKNNEHLCPYEPLFTGFGGEQITPEDIQIIFTQMKHKCGINITSDGLKKLYTETLRSNDVPESLIDYFLGQQDDPFPSSIMNPEVGLLKFWYEQVESELSLNQPTVSIPLEDYYRLLDNVEYLELSSYWLP